MYGSVAYLHVVKYELMERGNKAYPLFHADRRLVIVLTHFLLCPATIVAGSISIRAIIRGPNSALCDKGPFLSLILVGDVSQAVPTELISDRLRLFSCLVVNSFSIQ